MTGSPRRFYFLLWLSLALLLVVALLPWWRNHAYLRDLYDYGLVIAANGHLNLGERPYVDFTTPIQAGFLGLGWFFERLGGGNYGGLTLGAAALIVLAGVALPLMLARRWPWWAAAGVGAAVTVSAASQHTILWHNALGVIALALATWAVALAPVLRRGDWPWHLLAAAGLFLGGINKLNYSLVAVAVCAAWAFRAGCLRQAGWGRTVATLAAILIAGVVAPIAAELAWTGASPRLWLANVVELPASARTGILHEIFTGHFWLRPIHDYYGPLLLPQVGLVAAWLALWAALGCRPGAGARADRLFVPAAAVLALLAGAALLATNYEIAPLGAGAWLALVVSLWLGFAPARRSFAFVGGLVLPALLLGAAAWWSAWQGQRSQFGYSVAPRSAYVPAEQGSESFGFLRGLLLPPDVAGSFEVVERALPETDEAGYRRVFYGLGTEWLQRAFPARPEKGRPLWVHWGTSYGPAAIARLGARLAEEGEYDLVLATIARDEWPAELRTVLDQLYVRENLGPTLRRWTYRSRETVNLADGFETISRLGGNLIGQALHFDRNPLRFREVPGHELLLGAGRRPSSVLLRMPSYHLRGQATVNRLPGTKGPLAASFKIITHGGIPEHVYWGQRVELSAEQDSVTVTFDFDTLGQAVELWVLPEEASSGRLFAGYRALELTNSVEANEAPNVRPSPQADTVVTPELLARFFGNIAWRPEQAVIRGGTVGADGLVLAPGGELWLHTTNMTGELRGQLTALGDVSPLARVVWYKGGRLQLVQQGQVATGAPMAFHVWTAEPGGWIGILVNDGGNVPLQLRATSSTMTP